MLAKIYFYIKIKRLQKRSVDKSKSVILWQVYEQIAPLLKNFKYHPKDMVFIGKWIDYIVFDWLSSWKLRKIVFLEVKTWKSGLNINEKQIKDIVEQNKVIYELLKI